MDTIIELSWRMYPAAALMLVGALLAVQGARRAHDGRRRPLADPAKNLTWMRGFRRCVIGLALAGTGAAWAWHLGWLLALALAIGGEETLESSIAVYALRRQQPASGGPAAPRAPGTIDRLSRPTGAG